jgi:HlyD family secretion protein
MTNETDEHVDSQLARKLGIGDSAKQGRRFKWLGWGGVLILAGLVVAMWVGHDDSEALQYKTEAVQRGDLTVTVTATGTLQPTNQVDVGSELSGIVESVDVDYNDRVKVGQVLAKLDTSKLDAQVLQAKAALGQAKASVLEAKATVLETKLKYDRCVAMAEKQMCSPQDLDTDRAAYARAQAGEARAEAAVSQAQATLDAIQTDLSKAVIRSPINGIVLRRSVEPGQTVAASLQSPVLFTLAEDLTKMELQVDVDEADVGQVKEGQEATFAVDAYPGRRFPARIEQVRYGSETVQGVVTYEAILEVSNADLSLRPGMTATADIVVEKLKDALLVPNAALRFSPPEPDRQDSPRRGGSLLSRLFPRPRHATPRPREEAAAKGREGRVWTLQDGRLTAVPIETGASNGDMTEVTGGDLRPGQEVVVDVSSSGQSP